MTNKTHYIYGLFDPNTGAIRYIGRTVNLKTRQYSHNGYAVNEVKSAWVKTLKDAGQKPEMVVLEECLTLEAAKVAEHSWIRKCLDAGADLTNGIYPGYSRAGRRHN